MEVIEFYATDGVVLNGYINKGKVITDKILIELHGMTSNCFKKREEIIANRVEKLGIDTICFNTRGSDIIKYIKYGDGTKALAGTAYEDIEECYHDVLGAIKYALELGYTNIYLQGHSLGATKIVYSYFKMQKENSKFLKNIKGIILLSLVDLPYIINTETTIESVRYAEEKEAKNEILDLMPEDSFIHPISVKTFLKYVKYNKEIDFAQYSKEDSKFEVLNNIDIPLFMRWGDIQELIKKDANEQVEFMRIKIKNNEKDINYIKGADHSYDEKENELAEEICRFLEKTFKINN